MSFNMSDRISLNGNEYLATFFSAEEDSVMIIALGENMDNKKDGPTFVYLYHCIDGEVDHGIDAFAFKNGEEARKFIKNLPKMSAIDFMVRGLGVTPQIN